MESNRVLRSWVFHAEKPTAARATNRHVMYPLRLLDSPGLPDPAADHTSCYTQAPKTYKKTCNRYFFLFGLHHLRSMCALPILKSSIEKELQCSQQETALFMSESTISENYLHQLFLFKAKIKTQNERLYRLKTWISEDAMVFVTSSKLYCSKSLCLNKAQKARKS